jgi:hypothetical protein
MEERVSITLSFCEKCGSKVSSRNEVCSKCGTLPYQDDRKFFDENNYPIEDVGEWSDELNQKFDDWVEKGTTINFCKDCGMSVEEVEKFNFNDIVDENTGEVITENNHPCNPNSPIFE